MKFSAKFEGGQQLAKALSQLSTSVSQKVKVDALTAGAGFIQRMASSLAPRSGGQGEHLADNIVVAPVTRSSLNRRGRDTETVVEVGPSLKPDDFFYGFFQEFGTAQHAAQPFMRPAFDREAPSTSLNVIKAWLWDAIRKRIPAFRR
jgi:HK97 gp10 family phage protein